MRKFLIVFVSFCLLFIGEPANAHLYRNGRGLPYNRPTKQYSIKKRISYAKHKRLKEKRQYERRTTEVGHASTGTFQKAIPSWYSSLLLKYRGMILSAPAMRAYYEACQKVGHYIGGAGYRSHAVQSSMSSSLAAPAGYSYHELGLAADIFGVSAREHQALIAAGFQQLNGEPWHYSYIVYG